jgi:REP element-mobilizing transposase RayT
MSYDSHRHHRRSIRLKEYDYSQNGAYFITLCAHERQCLFGHIHNEKIVLNEYGIIVREEWVKSFKIRKELAMDEYIIMPNHFHGIVFILNATTSVHRSHDVIGHGNATIGSLVAGFKSAVTKRIRALNHAACFIVWQRNYHEHVIRHDKALDKIRAYTVNNPLTWQEDCLFNSNGKVNMG